MGNNQRERIAVPTPEGITNSQIVNVLGILHSLNPFLLHADAYREPGSTPVDHPKLDGEAFIAASATFIKCCSRLDDILADATRWNMEAHNSLFKSIEEVNMAQKKFLETQTTAAQQINRPSFQLKPKLALFEGSFVAYWGTLGDANGCIIGRGATPEKAMLDFDAAFQRSPDEQIYSIATKLGHDFSDEEKPKRKKK